MHFDGSYFLRKKQTQNKTNEKMSFLQIQNKENELILNTPNRMEILKAGPTNKQIKNNLLGRGAYGTVIKAIYKAKPVAVKIIKNLQDGNNQTMLNEANILGWKHPNVVRIFKIESTHNFGIVIMERFSGHCLQKIVDTIELPLMHRIFIALDILSGLIYCHKQDLLHLDIKPQNVMVALEYPQPRQILNTNGINRSYKCKICDFGSSIKISRDDSQQSKSLAKGTLRYMAPEALKEEHLTPAADIYSFGITLWQMKYRHMPFYWLECNEMVAYQVVKHKLRPNALQSNIEETSNNAHHHIHDTCFCETNSTNLSYHSLEDLRNILNKTKCELITEELPKVEYPTMKIDRPRNPLKDLSNNNKSSNNNSVKLNVKRNLQQDFIVIETFSLISIFKKNINFMECSVKEQLYEELLKSCWHSDIAQRPTTLELFKRFKEFM